MNVDSNFQYDCEMVKKIEDSHISWFICTISSGARHNWDIAKEFKLWGIPTSGRKVDLSLAKKNDNLIFYLASKGLVAHAHLTGGMKVPMSKEDAPWAGGVYRYGVVMPFNLDLELTTPLLKPFKNNLIEGTNISTVGLRKGFTRISSDDGLTLVNAMKLHAKIK